MEWDLDHLPQQLKDLVDIIGLPAVQRLVQHYGGVRVVVPEKMHAHHPLARLLGLEVAERLSHHYARERIDVPKALGAILAVRNAVIARDNAQGVSARRLALMHNLTERRIWEILAAQRVDDGQADLFDGA